MESSDRELLIEINGRLLSIEAEQARQANEISAARNEIREMREGQRILSVQVDALQTSVYWVLAAIGIFLAAIAVLPTWNRKQEKPAPEVKPETSITPSEILRMINAAMDARLPQKD